MKFVHRVHWLFMLLLISAAAGFGIWLLLRSAQPVPVAGIAFPAEWAALTAQISPSFQPRATTLAEGESLSAVHCQTCHMRPLPTVLPRDSWLEVLGHHIGIVADRDVPDPVHLSLPAKRLRNHRIPNGDLAKVIYFYLASAPERLPDPERPPMGATDAPFRIARAEGFNSARPAMYAMASILRGGKRIVLGEVVEQRLVILGADGREMHRLPLPGVTTGITQQRDTLIVTLIGPQPYTTNDALGTILRFPESVLDTVDEASPIVLLSKLRRPVHTTAADLDGDGQDELLVEEFGYSDGSLGYYKTVTGGATEYTNLLDLSGALSAYVVDFNQDGVRDVVGLISQATEGVYMLWGRGGGKFDTEVLVQNHPAFGANQLLVADMNNDEHTDLIVINGDRMDLPSQPMGNYSGIHVYANDTANHFAESYFYPLIGAVQAVSRDFDKDGDLDIVAVSATPDFGRLPVETAVYLENRGNMTFLPHRIPGAERGCWSVIAAGDLDQDGYDDLVLGAAYLPIFAEEISRAFGAAPPASLMILMNAGKQNGE